MIRKIGLLVFVMMVAGCASPRPDPFLSIRMAHFEKRYDFAQAKCQEVLKREPTNATAFFWLGQIANAQGEHRKALEQYERFRELDPDNYLAPNALGWSYYALGEYEKAIWEFQKANDLKKSSHTYLGLGYVFTALNKVEEAIRALEEAKAFFSHSPEVPMALGNAYEQARYYDKALAEFSKINTVQGRLKQAGVLQKIGNLDAAEKLLREEFDRYDQSARATPSQSLAKQKADEILLQIRQEMARCALQRGNRSLAAEHLQGRPFFGFTMTDHQDGALLILDVTPHSPAEEGGLKTHDVVRRIRGVTLTNGTRQVQREVLPKLKFCEEVPFLVERQGAQVELRLIAGIDLNAVPAHAVTDTPARSGDLSERKPVRRWAWAREAIAVANLEPIGVAPAEAAVLSENVRAALVESDCFHVISRADMEKILKEVQFQKSDACSDTECLVEMGKILAARTIIGGAVGKAGGVHNVTLRMIDIESGRIEMTVYRDIEDPKALLASARALGAEMALKFAEKRNLQSSTP